MILENRESADITGADFTDKHAQNQKLKDFSKEMSLVLTRQQVKQMRKLTVKHRMSAKNRPESKSKNVPNYSTSSTLSVPPTPTNSETINYFENLIIPEFTPDFARKQEHVNLATDLLSRSRAPSMNNKNRQFYEQINSELYKAQPSYLSSKVEDIKLKKWKSLKKHERLVEKRSGHTQFSTDYNISFRDSSWNWMKIMDLDVKGLLLSMVLIFPCMWASFGLVYFVLNLWICSDVERMERSGLIQPNQKSQSFNETGYWEIPESYNGSLRYDSCLNSVDSRNELGHLVLRFREHYLYSFEGQTTIGYGSRNPSHNFQACKWFIFVQALQPILSTAMEGCLIFLVFMKLLDSSKSKAIYLLKNCCIHTRDSHLVLVIRTAVDPKCYPKYSHIIGTSVSATLLITHESDEGEWVFLEERELKLDMDGFLGGPLPVDLVHIMNDESPLYDLRRETVETFGLGLEIVVRVNGTFESTGAMFQTMQSYTTNDIFWGRRFQQCVFPGEKFYEVDHDRIEEVDTVEIGGESQEDRDKEIKIRKELGEKQQASRFVVRKVNSQVSKKR